ncbi:hypothetical protein BIFGAL_03311 [Bifidobacterium gallicum DSM 20093 = LMG 11596]|uniref:Uncharacterized protein n=1 Tax=Bifidobacterium gallicum DSM 20093 = LMG 11596 TaxID=561180 RepID=D1NTZ0_9BIFI|nr:hypothetical protein BIFGAL_03311 [Bifidobacterium gallicum DSM 20093 = LMG 11596]
MAVSQKDYVALLLQQTDGRAPDSVKDTLQRALDHEGTISQQDYNQAWQNFSQCIVDCGYSQPVLFTLSNGMKELPLSMLRTCNLKNVTSCCKRMKLPAWTMSR